MQDPISSSYYQSLHLGACIESDPSRTDHGFYSGVVVNDSLVLVDWINRRRSESLGLAAAVRDAGVARFRPILLTSLTTFMGLLPLIFEKSTQAQLLIPMAVSLRFGVLYATFLTLLLVPVAYLILDDASTFVKQRLFNRPQVPEEGV